MNFTPDCKLLGLAGRFELDIIAETGA